MDILKQCQIWHGNDDDIPYTPQNAEAFFQQLEQWNDENEFLRCIQALNAIPEDWRNDRTACALARALENYAILGDRSEGTPHCKGDKVLLRAIEVLESVREKGQNQAAWNMQMACAYRHLRGQEEKAIPYAQRWAGLAPEDEEAQAVIRACREAIAKRAGAAAADGMNHTGASLPGEQMAPNISRAPSEGAGDEPEDELPGKAVSSVCETYSKEEMAAVENHIRQYFGKFETLFHELCPPDIHVDICLVPPTRERDYCTLVTLGMGAHRMNAPRERAKHRPERAELAIALPAGWKRTPGNFKDDRWYWPVYLLKDLARLSIGGAWLSRGHITDHQKPFAANTWLCAALLADPFSAAPGGAVCTLPSGEEVHFYQVLPLYRNELKYSLEHGTDALLEKMAAIGFVVWPDRPDAITQGILRSAEDAADDILEMDNGLWHLTTLRKKKLPVDELNAFSHMTIYLRWCMEHDLMGAAFLEDYGSIVKQVKANPGRVDLRAFLRDKLNGQLISLLFNRTGRGFAAYYYGYTDDPPHYPSDFDSYAVGIIGQKRNYSDEIQDEAYLFLPYDEEYYQAMAQVIDRRFAGWQRQRFNEATLKPSRLARAMMEYLDCDCTYFPSMKDDDPISAAYSYAQRDSAHEGFVPVLIQADNETLWECLILHSDPDSDGVKDYAFDPDKVAAYRKKMLAAPVMDGRALLEERIVRRKAKAGAGKPNRKTAIPDKSKGRRKSNRFASYWDSGSEMTYPLILAKIPVKKPWEIFAYLPFGGWNDCPDTPALMAVAKYWFAQHGAVPAVMNSDELEFVLPAPVSEAKAMETAAEQYGFCPSGIDPGPDDTALGALADALQQSTVWYFWWD